MKILITGAQGFVGRNLVAQLKNEGYQDIDTFTLDNTVDELKASLAKADFIFHLAGVNRPKNKADFYSGNSDLTKKITDTLIRTKHAVPILMSSSIQAALDNDYGKSKHQAELAVLDYGTQLKVPVYVYRLKNLFGKWSRPNYNSVTATFAYNLSHDLPIKINDANAELELSYIDDVIASFIDTMKNGYQFTSDSQFCNVPISYNVTLGKLAGKLKAFHDSRKTLIMPSLRSQFDRDLYATYLSYLDKDNFSYKLKKNEDDRGWLAEFIKSKDNGQIFVSTTKPGITRGNHWHHTKVEKFLVVQGEGLIEFRQIDGQEVLKYQVSGDHPEVVDIPAGYIHNISNIGTEKMVTIFWACEIFDPENPDTYYEGV
ncbi:MAG: NAD-dependent epimerase/dehydratase family protein [Lactobacillaceae bacterium]|jgi:UDP-2-acetamido-2,6-beta-L-arabino-hexul-4-ose reductase|nr:NAD-dependent epimerase/dehydratase family protein [Lactobacillaceae bacterium]